MATGSTLLCALLALGVALGGAAPPRGCRRNRHGGLAAATRLGPLPRRRRRRGVRNLRAAAAPRSPAGAQPQAEPAMAAGAGTNCVTSGLDLLSFCQKEQRYITAKFPLTSPKPITQAEVRLPPSLVLRARTAAHWHSRQRCAAPACLECDFTQLRLTVLGRWSNSLLANPPTCPPKGDRAG